MALRQLQIAREKRLATLPSLPFPLLHEPLPEEHIKYSTVDDIHYSENAMLLFCHNTVIKRLLAYKDQRYNQLEMQKRHECLLEGLLWNRKFTQGIHLGLVPIYDWILDQRKIGLGKVLRNPGPGDLDLKAEYALLMFKLPKEYRLDILIKERLAIISDKSFARLLSSYLVNMHYDFAAPCNSAELWGNVNQLKKKLEGNLANVEKPEKVAIEILRSGYYKSLLAISDALKTYLLPIFEQSEYVTYFEGRLREGQIKRCHGDLKARNIWILPPGYAKYKHLHEGVNVLDAIDFNPSYCNIDTLSDMAMLAIDLQVRTQSSQLANIMIEEYLEQTRQVDRASRFILQYYLVEKAFVGAYVSILYDKLFDLGKAYLHVAQTNLADLKRLISS